MSSFYRVLDSTARHLSNWFYPKPESSQPYDKLKQKLLNAGLLEENQNDITFSDRESGKSFRFAEGDRGERLKKYLQEEYADQLSPSSNNSSSIDRAMLGLLGITVLTNAVIAPALLALEQLQVFEKAHKLSQSSDLPCHVGLIAGGLCSIGNKNRESCLALPILACLGRAQAELSVKQPIFNQTAHVGEPFDALIDTSEIFSNPFVTIKAVQTGTKSVPSWLSLNQKVKEPQVIASFVTDNAQDIYANGNFLYVAAGNNGLQILDITNPTNPVSINSWSSVDGSASRITVDGNFAYMIVNFDYDSSNTKPPSTLQIFDVGDRAKPRSICSYSIIDETSNDIIMYASDLTVTNDHVYLTTCTNEGEGDYSELQIIDVSNSTNPILVGSLKMMNQTAKGVAVDENFAYIADGDNGLQIINIFNPKNPVSVSSWSSANGHASRVTVDGNFAYVANGFAGLAIIDISNSTTPALMATVLTSAIYAMNVVIENPYAYVADSIDGLIIIDVSNPKEPLIKEKLSIYSGVVNVYLQNPYAFVVAQKSEIQIVGNLFGPGNLVKISEVDTDDTTNDVLVTDNYVYVADGDKGLKIVNVAKPNNPYLCGMLNIGANVLGVVVFDNYAYVAADDKGLQIIDISNPIIPRSVGYYYPQDGSAQSITIVDNYVYLLNVHSKGNSNLQIFNINNSTTPVSVGSWHTDNHANSFTIADHYAYVTYLNNTSPALEIIDVHDPITPSSIGSWILNNDDIDFEVPDAVAVAIDGIFAYIADGFHDLQIIDIVDKFHPSSVGHCDDISAEAITVVGRYAYIVEEHMLEIIDIGDVNTPSLVTYQSVGGITKVRVRGNYIYTVAGNSGLKIFAASSYHLAGTPTYYDRKPYSITLTATDLEQSVSTNFTIDFPNNTPVANPIPNQTTFVGKDFYFLLPTGTFTDKDSDIAEYTAQCIVGPEGHCNNVNGLPQWLTFYTASHSFLGKATSYDEIGDYNLQVTATDSYGASASTGFTLTVNNTPPTVHNLINVQRTSTMMSSPWTFSIPKETFNYVDVSMLTYSAKFDGKELPKWLKFKDGSFSGKPPKGHNIGSSEIEITATDPFQNNVTTAFTLIISRGEGDLSPLDQLKQVLSSLGYVSTALSAMLTAYFTRGKIRNWLKKYKTTTDTAIIGNDYSYKITSTEADRIREIRVTKGVVNQKGKKKWSILPAGLLKPEWLKYDPRDNILRTLNGEMTEKDAGEYRIQIIGTDKGINEEIFLALRSASAPEQSSAPRRGGAIELDSLKERLLTEREEV